MKACWLYESDHISLQLCVCITLKKRDIYNNYLCKYSNWHLNAIFYCKWSQLLLGGIIVEKLKNQLWGIFLYFDTRVPTPKVAIIYNFFNIASVILFRFIIIWLFLFIVVLLLFGCCHFWQHYEVWVQFITVGWVLQDTGLILYIYCVSISNTSINFICCIVIFLSKI